MNWQNEIVIRVLSQVMGRVAARMMEHQATETITSLEPYITCQAPNKPPLTHNNWLKCKKSISVVWYPSSVSVAGKDRSAQVVLVPIKTIEISSTWTTRMMFMLQERLVQSFTSTTCQTWMSRWGLPRIKFQSQIMVNLNLRDMNLFHHLCQSHRLGLISPCPRKRNEWRCLVRSQGPNMVTYRRLDRVWLEATEMVLLLRVRNS